eukprot:COSAG01_NODE_3003_length_6735_cov_344.499247_2_plen_170_part_00
MPSQPPRCRASLEPTRCRCLLSSRRDDAVAAAHGRPQHTTPPAGQQQRRPARDLAAQRGTASQPRQRARALHPPVAAVLQFLAQLLFFRQFLTLRRLVCLLFFLHHCLALAHCTQVYGEEGLAITPPRGASKGSTATDRRSREARTILALQQPLSIAFLDREKHRSQFS